MKGRDIVKAILEDLEVSKTNLAEKLGITPANLSERLKQKTMDIPATMLAGTIEPLGYKLVAVPRTMELNDRCYVVDPIVSEGERGKGNVGRRGGAKVNKLDELDLDALLSEAKPKVDLATLLEE